MSLFYIERRQTPSLYIRESVSLLYVEEADSFSVQRRECLSSVCRGERLLLYTEERVSLLDRDVSSQQHKAFQQWESVGLAVRRHSRLHEPP